MKQWKSIVISVTSLMIQYCGLQNNGIIYLKLKMEPAELFFAKVSLGLYFCKNVARSLLFCLGAQMRSITASASLGTFQMLQTTASAGLGMLQRFKHCKLQYLLVLERFQPCKLQYLLVLECFKCCKLQQLLVLKRPLVLKRFKCCKLRHLVTLTSFPRSIPSSSGKKIMVF